MALVLIARWFSVFSGTFFSFAKYYLANNTSYVRILFPLVVLLYLFAKLYIDSLEIICAVL